MHLKNSYGSSFARMGQIHIAKYIFITCAQVLAAQLPRRSFQASMQLKEDDLGDISFKTFQEVCIV